MSSIKALKGTQSTKPVFIHHLTPEGREVVSFIPTLRRGKSHKRQKLPNVGATAVDAAVPNAGADDNADPKLKPNTAKKHKHNV